MKIVVSAFILPNGTNNRIIGSGDEDLPRTDRNLTAQRGPPGAKGPFRLLHIQREVAAGRPGVWANTVNATWNGFKGGYRKEVLLKPRQEVPNYLSFNISEHQD